MNHNELRRAENLAIFASFMSGMMASISIVALLWSLYQLVGVLGG